jgi:hypothetical protein
MAEFIKIGKIRLATSEIRSVQEDPRSVTVFTVSGGLHVLEGADAARVLKWVDGHLFDVEKAVEKFAGPAPQGKKV